MDSIIRCHYLCHSHESENPVNTPSRLPTGFQLCWNDETILRIHNITLASKLNKSGCISHHKEISDETNDTLICLFNAA